MKTAVLLFASFGMCMSSDSHTCGGLVLPKEMVNDDYCDCADGSDEPRTSACAGLEQRLTYWCENEGHKGKMISQTQINDGICDCCDGTDEFSTTAGCVNNCVEVATVYAKEEARLKAIRDAGLARKAELVAEAKRMIAEKEAQKQQWVSEKTKLDSDLATSTTVKSTQEAIEQAERSEIVKKSEAEKVIWEQGQVHKRNEAARQRAENAVKHADAVQKFGAVTVGGQVELISELKFTSGSTAPEGLSGTVLSAVNEVGSGLMYGISLENGIKFKTNNLSFFRPKSTQTPIQKKTQEKATPEAIEPAYQPCIGWQQTAGCDPEGAHETKASCSATIEDGSSGFCECRPTPAPQGEIIRHKFTCSHKSLTCQYVCEMNGAVGDSFDQPCPDAFPYPVVSAASEFFGKVCYNSKENAEAGGGPCETWCARDSVWYEQHRCTWGCECGDMCEDSDDEGEASEPQFETVDLSEESFTVDTGASHTRQEAEDARTDFNSVQSKVTDLESKITSITKELETNYGPDSVFLPLRGRCVEYTTPEYVYKLCPFEKVTQGHTTMGNWESWGTQTYGAWGGQDDLTIQKYTNVCESFYSTC